MVCKKCKYAFINRRQAAYIVDVLVRQLPSYIPMVLLGATPGIGTLGALRLPSYPSPEFLIIFFGWVFPMTFYFKDGFGGRSPGKALCGLRVIHWETREPVGFGRSIPAVTAVCGADTT